MIEIEHDLPFSHRKPETNYATNFVADHQLPIDPKTRSLLKHIRAQGTQPPRIQRKSFRPLGSNWRS